MREFPSVFSMTTNLLTRVSEYFEVNNRMVGWHPISRWLTFDWEVHSIALLLEKIGSSVVRHNQEDMKILVDNIDGMYSVKAGVHFFGRWTDIFGSWKEIWYNSVSPKVQFFLWVASLGKISTIDVLRKKRSYPRQYLQPLQE